MVRVREGYDTLPTGGRGESGQGGHGARWWTERSRSSGRECGRWKWGQRGSCGGGSRAGIEEEDHGGTNCWTNDLSDVRAALMTRRVGSIF